MGFIGFTGFVGFIGFIGFKGFRVRVYCLGFGVQGSVAKV